MANAVSSELLKLGRRRMTWVMTLLLFGLSFVGFFLFLILTDQKPAELPTLIRDSYLLVSLLGILLGLVFGASSCGWEFANHTFPSVLAREPNRMVIWTAKLIVLASISLVFALAAGIGGLLGLILASAATSIPTQSGWLAEAIQLWFGGLGQSTVMIFSAAALGACMAMIFKSTVGSVVVGLAFIYIVNGLIGAALELQWADSSEYLYSNVVWGFGTLTSIDNSPNLKLSYATMSITLAAWTTVFILVGFTALRYRNIS